MEGQAVGYSALNWDGLLELSCCEEDMGQSGEEWVGLGWDEAGKQGRQTREIELCMSIFMATPNQLESTAEGWLHFRGVTNCSCEAVLPFSTASPIHRRTHSICEHMQISVVVGSTIAFLLDDIGKGWVHRQSTDDHYTIWPQAWNK
jgi:hypothetical protein